MNDLKLTNYQSGGGGGGILDMLSGGGDAGGIVSQFGSLLGGVVGRFMAPPKPTSTTGWGSKAQSGNIEVWARPGIGFTISQASPGVYVIVEYQTGSPVVGNMWVDIGQGVANAANTLTSGLVNTIANWIPGARKHQREQAASDAAAELRTWEAQQAALQRVELAKARDQVKMEAMIRRIAAEEADDDRSSSRPFTLLARPAPSIAGACCTGCAHGRGCESSCSHD